MKWSETSTPYRDPRSHGTNSIVVERKGYNVRTRGDTTGTIEHEYECPVHGRFKATVPRVEVPDEVCCPNPAGHSAWVVQRWAGSDGRCMATWVPPLVGVGKSSGEVVE